MHFLTLALPDWANSLLSVAIAVGLIFIYLLQRKLFGRNQESRRGWTVWVLYLVDLVLFFAALIGGLLLWNFDFQSFLTKFVTDFQTMIVDKVGAIIESIVIIFIVLALLKLSKLALLKVGLKESPFQKRKKTIAKVSQSIIKYLLWVIAILVILSLWGVNVAPALAGLGIAGIVIGLGAQKFINDLISGFFIVFEHHFDVGDIVEVAGFKGEVTDIGLKTTKIRNWKGEVKILANGEVSNITNFSRNPSTAVIDFGIAYGEDIEKTIKLLQAELPKLEKEVAEIIDAPQVLGVMELSDSSVNMRVIVKTLTEKHYGVERLVRQRIKEILDANGIEIPFPQVVLHQAKDK